MTISASTSSLAQPLFQETKNHQHGVETTSAHAPLAIRKGRVMKSMLDVASGSRKWKIYVNDLQTMTKLVIPGPRPFLVIPLFFFLRLSEFFIFIDM